MGLTWSHQDLDEIVHRKLKDFEPRLFEQDICGNCCIPSWSPSSPNSDSVTCQAELLALT